MSGFKRSLGIAFLTQYAEMAIQFVGLIILARLISSTEVGIYSVAAFLMALLHVFRDFGVGKYLVAEEHLTREKIRSAFGVGIMLAVGVAVLMYACRGPVADFYNEPRIKDIVAVMALSFAITPVGSLIVNIFRRNMEMRKVAIVRISSTVCHTAVSIVLAMLGYGAMSLAWANFASILAFGIVALMMRPASIPLTPSFRNIGEILSFGSISSLGSLAMVGGSNAPDVIIGKSISLAATGYFSRANGMVQMFRTMIGNAIIPLVMPYFSQLRRENGDLRGAYHQAVAHLTGVAWPFFAVLAVLALPVTRTLYGPDWDTSVPVARLLCLSGAVSMLSMFAGEVMTAYGYNKAVTQLHLVIQPVRVAAILAASPYGLQAVGWALIGSECVALIVTSYLLSRTIKVDAAGVLAATGKSALVTVCSIAGPAAIIFFWGDDGHFLLLTAAGGVAALAGWFLGNIWTAHPIHAHLDDAKLWVLANVRRER